MATIALILLVAAFLLALLAALNVGSPRFNLLAGALACYFLAVLLGRVG